MWFFRDPERVIPSEPGAVVSPADGKVTEVANVRLDGREYKRISIFLNVFNVHVNRAPVAGVIRGVRYQEGRFLNAMDPACAECNEQNTVTLAADGQQIVFKQIAGLLARRIVFTKKIGDKVERGERVGLIKFGSRTDVFLPSAAEVSVRAGDHVNGGSTILATLKAEERQLAGAARSQSRSGERPDA
jgi:phosphatidylserine decarboxylase